MRVNVYAEEITERVEITTKGKRIGVSFHLELPVTAPDGTQIRGRFMHRPNDDDSGAVVFWGDAELLRAIFQKAIAVLDAH